MLKQVIILGLVMLSAIILSPQKAHAQFADISVTSLVGVCAAGSNNGANILVFAPKANQGQGCGGNLSVFGRFFCITQTTLNLIISKSFCKIRDAWTEPFAAMMILLMTITGLSFITGILEFSVKDISLILFKMALITLFVSNADIALNVAYRFYIGLVTESVTMLKDGFNNLNPQMQNQGSFDEVDNLFSYMPTIAGSYSGGEGGEFKRCSMLKFLMTILMVFPIAAIFVLIAVIVFAAFFARAAYGYIYALVMITFLLAAMPIFVSFALFQTTNDLFESWLKYIGSMAIQILIVFSVMAFAVLIDFSTFIRALDKIIVPYDWPILSFLGFDVITLPLCSICEPSPGYIESISVLNAGGPAFQGGACLNTTQIPYANTDPKPIPFAELFKRIDLGMALVVNGAALFFLTAVMDQFMKQAPDIARMLGGAKLTQTIGGTTKSAGGVTSSLHRFTEKFESGVRRVGLNDTEDDGSILRGNVISKTMRALGGGFDEATYNLFTDQDAYLDSEEFKEEASPHIGEIERLAAILKKEGLTQTVRKESTTKLQNEQAQLRAIVEAGREDFKRPQTPEFIRYMTGETHTTVEAVMPGTSRSNDSDL